MKVKVYKLSPKTLRMLVDWAQAGINSMTGRAYGSDADRALIRGFARDLGLIPPVESSRLIPPMGRTVPQIEATEKLASATSAHDLKRRELVIHGTKTV